MVDLNKILTEAISVVKTAGGFISSQLNAVEQGDIQYKGKNDLVSFVDKAAEEILVEGLSKAFPDAGFLTEEGSATVENRAYRWVIDPLDGTTNYLHKVPVFAVSVALIKEGEPILGIVYELNRHELFTAIKGNGAFCNEKAIKVSGARTLSESLLATGFPYSNFSRMETYLSILREFMQDSHGLRRMGSAAVDLAYVACGRFEAFFEYSLNPWDVAAGILLVQEAGGKVTDFSGGNNYLFGKEIIASNLHLHDEVEGTIQKYWR